MAKPIETLSIQLKFKDAGSQAAIEKVKGSLKQLQLGASGATPRIKGLRNEILAQGRASINSVSNINAQRNALAALRDEARIGGKNFKQLTEDIKKLDAQLGKTSKKSGNMGARRATQTAGAIISGGIFGGPEGAIGGALGAFGGVEGAFAGAAIGAQVGMLRQAVGDMANYAASIEKLKIALNGILPEQDEFNFALQVASQATRELNIPQEQSIRGMTRLSAAVTGAGGPVQDAAVTFRNVTAAIKATGGSAEDVQGAITAMVQVFSKGKVSAEELSGQLGERLPGAVTLFAKANKMTLPELQKNLKAGTVGLNELMNFIVELGNKFDGTARQISDSNAEAGARLSVAIQDMQADVGAALIPIGGQFQAAFADFVRNITPYLVQILPTIGNLFLQLAKNLDTLVVAATAAFSIFAAAKIAAIVASIGTISAALELVRAKLVTIGLLNPFTALALGAGALAGAIYNASKEQSRFNGLVRDGTVAQVEQEIKQKQLERDRKIQLKLDAIRIAGGEQNLDPITRATLQQPIDTLGQQLDQLQERRRSAIYDREQGADLPLSLLPRFKYAPVTTEDGGGTAGTIKDITEAQADALIAQIGLRRRDVELTKEQIQAAAQAAREAAKALPTQKQRVELAKINNQEANQIFALEEKQARTAKNKARAQNELNELLAKAKGEQGILNDKQLQAELNQIKVNELMLKFNILVKEGVYSYDELKEKVEAAVAAMNKAESPMETFRKGLKEIFEEALNINQALAELGVQAVQDFGDAFADFVATGKANFSDFANSIIKDLARIFAKRALFQGLSLIPGVGSFLGLSAKGSVIGGVGGPPTTMPDSVSLMAANGMAFAKNKIVPYAKGGIVGRPTFFQYARGGYGNFGLMGEAGPEAIMPLRRGANGKLGVEASGAGIGNVTVNVDAAGSSVEGDSSQASQLGKAIGVAVQQELIKQKRPGGLLAS